MDTKRLSVLHQRAKGTYQRNEQIRWLAASDSFNYAQLGRLFKLSRQAIRKIVSEASDNSKVV